MQKGYGIAEKQLGDLGRERTQGVLDRESGLMGQMQQSMTSRGLSGTTVLDNARRGVSADTTRQLSMVAEDIAGSQAQLATQAAQAEAAMRGSLSDLAVKQGQDMAQIGLERYRLRAAYKGGQVRGGVPAGYQPTGGASSLGGLLGSLNWEGMSDWSGGAGKVAGWVNTMFGSGGQ